MPFITEEIWLQVAPRTGAKGETVMLQTFPMFDPAQTDNEAVAELEWIKQFILGIRQIRGEMDISPGKELPVLLENASARDEKFAQENGLILKRVGRVASIRNLDDGEAVPKPGVNADVDPLSLADIAKNAGSSISPRGMWAQTCTPFLMHRHRSQHSIARLQSSKKAGRRSLG